MDITLTRDNNITTGKIYQVGGACRLDDNRSNAVPTTAKEAARLYCAYMGVPVPPLRLGGDARGGVGC